MITRFKFAASDFKKLCVMYLISRLIIIIYTVHLLHKKLRFLKFLLIFKLLMVCEYFEHNSTNVFENFFKSFMIYPINIIYFCKTYSLKSLSYASNLFNNGIFNMMLRKQFSNKYITSGYTFTPSYQHKTIAAENYKIMISNRFVMNTSFFHSFNWLHCIYLNHEEISKFHMDKDFDYSLDLLFNHLSVKILLPKKNEAVAIWERNEDFLKIFNSKDKPLIKLKCFDKIDELCAGTINVDKAKSLKFKEESGELVIVLNRRFKAETWAMNEKKTGNLGKYKNKTVSYNGSNPKHSHQIKNQNVIESSERQIHKSVSSSNMNWRINAIERLEDVVLLTMTHVLNLFPDIFDYLKDTSTDNKCLNNFKFLWFLPDVIYFKSPEENLSIFGLKDSMFKSETYENGVEGSSIKTTSVIFRRTLIKSIPLFSSELYIFTCIRNRRIKSIASTF